VPLVRRGKRERFSPQLPVDHPSETSRVTNSIGQNDQVSIAGHAESPEVVNCRWSAKKAGHASVPGMHKRFADENAV
jgi:hypothetical protein